MSISVLQDVLHLLVSGEDEYKNLPPPFDPYQTDPKRDPALVIQAAKPFNAECPLRLGKWWPWFLDGCFLK